MKSSIHIESIDVADGERFVVHLSDETSVTVTIGEFLEKFNDRLEAQRQPPFSGGPGFFHG